MSSKILVVDDDLTIRNVVRGYLEQNGYQVFVAADGATTMQAIRSAKLTDDDCDVLADVAHARLKNRPESGQWYE